MDGRPTGTVTFLFTDILGSTRLWEEHRASMERALARHDEILRGAIIRHGGVVFATGGDGVAAVFSRAFAAVVAAVEAQKGLQVERWPPEVPLRVRMGVHTGEAQERDGDYFGPVVNRAARVMGVADGGHVLVTVPTADIVRSLLPEDLALVDVGDRDLKGVALPERVFEVRWPGSPTLAMRGERRAGGNLPRRAPDVLGREDELTTLCELLMEHPLVTLTGVGGAGKTTLALAAAHRLRDGYRDGVWFADLSSVLTGDEVPRAVAEMLGLRPQAAVGVDEAVTRAFMYQECLLILDNAEHVLDATAALAEAVGERCEAVTVLATSREGLGVRGEHLVGVRPLAVADAVELFRVRVGEHHGVVGEADHVLVAELCERLDGLPLAIELAAARARSMSVADLTDRLGDRFRLLRGQRRSADRHQTLRATVAWSYDLLSTDERRLFDRLSVFTGGFVLAAAESVCTDDDLDAIDIDDLVVTLADKSMIVAEPSGRYRLLETLRQFGEERLHETGDPDRLRRAHLDYVASFVIACHDGLQGPDQPVWLDRLHAEWANVRAAFGWALADGDVTAAAGIATNLIWAATFHDVSEPFAWVQEVAAMPGAQGGPDWHDVLACGAWAAWEANRLEDALSLALEALQAEPPGARTIDYFAEMAALSAAASLSKSNLHDQFVRQLVERTQLDHRPVHMAFAAAALAIRRSTEGRADDAIATARYGRAVAVATGNAAMSAFLMNLEGAMLASLGDVTATRVLEQALDLASESTAVLAALGCHQILIPALVEQGRPAEAVPLVLDALRVVRTRPVWLSRSLLLAALVLGEIGDLETAATVHAAIDTTSMDGYRNYDPLLDRVRRNLAHRSGTDLNRDIATARQLAPEQAATLAEDALLRRFSSGTS